MYVCVCSLKAPLTLANNGETLYCAELDVHYAIVNGVPQLKTVGIDMAEFTADGPESNSSGKSDDSFENR